MNRYQNRISALINKLSQEPYKNYSLDELASYCHTSKFHFHRLFKAITGETVHQLSSRLRLEKAAARLIYARQLAITDIAYEFGFSSSANFSKAFQLYYLCSPSEYRKLKNRSKESSKFGKASNSLKRDNVSTLIMPNGIEIKKRSDKRLAYLRARGAYEPEKIAAMFQRLNDWTGRNQIDVSDEPIFMVNWSDTFIAEQNLWTYDVGIVVPDNCNAEDDIQIQNLVGGVVAEGCFSLHPKDFAEELQHAWDDFLGGWFINSNHQLSHKPSYEYYGQFNDQGQQAVTLCLPLEPT